MTAAIRTNGLGKRYGRTLALDSLELAIEPGEVYGYLGPNGAGKTTTIRLLLGLHRPSAGSAELFGIDATRDPVAAHRRVAYVAGEPFLWPALTSAETFEYLARLRGGADVAYRDRLVERFKLDVDKKVRALSKGNRQKVQLIAALASRAELLILDEPTAGLDPLMEVAFRESVGEAKERGQTIFLSSHILSEVEALCDRVGILSNGRLVDEGTLEQLRHLSHTVDVTFEGAGAATAESKSLREQIHKLGGASIVSPTGALGFYFLIFTFAIGLFACAQISAARHEESESRLETLFALPVSRRAWLGGRLALAAAAALVLVLAAGVLAWAAAESQGAQVALGGLLEAGLNCMPSALFFLGISALAVALVPRATAAVAYSLVSVAFSGTCSGRCSGCRPGPSTSRPSSTVGLVPAQSFEVTEALIMLGVAALAMAGALWAFERRDVLGA